MTSNRPYLLRALHEWILDNNMTPYILVDATDITGVPDNYIDNNNQIILNVHPDAVNNLVMGNVEVTFNARFGGLPQQILLPVNSIAAIYAKESGKGLVFPSAQEEQDQNEDNTTKRSRPDLKLIK